MEKLHTVSKPRPGADCGSNHELLIAKIRHKLKKVGKITRPFRYDLNQIPYDYTVKVRNSRFLYVVKRDQKRHAFNHRELECKSRKSRDTWSNEQV